MRLCVFERHLFLTSAGYDSILGFNLETEIRLTGHSRFVTDGRIFGDEALRSQWRRRPVVDRQAAPEQCPLRRGRHVYQRIAYRRPAQVRRQGGWRHDDRFRKALTTLNPFRDGILFNDTRSGRGAIRKSRQSKGVPCASLRSSQVDAFESWMIRASRARGLAGDCALSPGSEIAAGSSPSTISIYDLDEQNAVKVINLSLDVRNAIHGIEVWPYEWPDR